MSRRGDEIDAQTLHVVHRSKERRYLPIRAVVRTSIHVPNVEGTAEDRLNSRACRLQPRNRTARHGVRLIEIRACAGGHEEVVGQLNSVLWANVFAQPAEDAAGEVQ